jgi:hypothetical protein
MPITDIAMSLEPATALPIPIFDEPALRNQATRRALVSYVGRAVAVLLAARAELVVAKWLEDPPAGENPSGWLAALGLFAFCFGLLRLLNAARMWWWLRKHPWTAWRCQARLIRRSRFANRGSAQLLLHRGDDAGHVLSVISTTWRWRALQACDDGVMWMAGDPGRGGVVAPPGGRQLVSVRRTTPAKMRERLRRELAAPSTN